MEFFVLIQCWVDRQNVDIKEKIMKTAKECIEMLKNLNLLIIQYYHKFMQDREENKKRIIMIRMMKHDRRRGAPIDELTRRHLEGRAVQGADDDVSDDVGALAHGRADVRAEVAHAEDVAVAVLAHQ